jgi:hypothetical protein
MIKAPEKRRGRRMTRCELLLSLGVGGGEGGGERLLAYLHSAAYIERITGKLVTGKGYHCRRSFHYHNIEESHTIFFVAHKVGSNG